MKMTLYNISETDLFLETLKSCRGDVALLMQDGEWYDINEHADIIRSFFHQQQNNCLDRVVLQLKEGRDIERLYRFASLRPPGESG